jgi:cell division protein FtsL
VARLNLLLLAVAIACALGVITAQHKSRLLFMDLEAGQARAKKLDEEFTQLQLEQGAWSTNKRVEAVASRSLGMRLPEAGATRVVTVGAAPEGERP